MKMISIGIGLLKYLAKSLNALIGGVMPIV